MLSDVIVRQTDNHLANRLIQSVKYSTDVCTLATHFESFLSWSDWILDALSRWRNCWRVDIINPDGTLCRLKPPLLSQQPDWRYHWSLELNLTALVGSISLIALTILIANYCWLKPRTLMVTIADWSQEHWWPPLLTEAKNPDGHHCWLKPRTLMVTIADWGQEPWWPPLLTEAKNPDGHHCWMRPRTLMATIADWGQEPWWSPLLMRPRPLMATIADCGQEPWWPPLPTEAKNLWWSPLPNEAKNPNGHHYWWRSKTQMYFTVCSYSTIFPTCF